MTNELMAAFGNNSELSKKLADAGISGATSLTVEEAEESTGVKASRYFPFLQLLQRTSNAIGDSKPGTFQFRRNGQDQNPANLGDKFEAIVVAVRGKATYYDGEIVKAEYHTPKLPPSDTYKDYLAKAKEDTGPKSKYRGGLDVLLWIKELRSFATYFANTVSTTANVEQMIVPFAPREGTDFVPVSILSQSRSNTKGTWYVPSAAELPQETVETWEQRDMFTVDNLTDALKLFLLPPKSAESNIEGAEEIVETKSPRKR
jgi:hypothetical protein